MSYATIMVHIDLGPATTDRIKLALAVATTFEATLIGVAARQTDLMIYGSGRHVDMRFVDAEEERAIEALKQAKALFERDVDYALDVTLRSAIAEPLRYLVRQARAADLVVIGRNAEKDGAPGEFGISVGPLLM